MENIKKNYKIKRRDDAAIVGKTIGPFYVEKYVDSRNQQRFFQCICILCGNRKELPKAQINFGKLKSCGCLKTYKNMEEVFQLNTIDKDECLIWTGSLTKEGYGQFTLKGQTYRAHRAHWLMYMGQIPEKTIIGHHCDNRNCVKISHLYQALPFQNSKDMVNKGRQAKGEKNGSSKLKEDEVIEILKLLKNKSLSIREIAKNFNVHPTAIRRIENGKTWKHLSKDSLKKSEASFSNKESFLIDQHKQSTRSSTIRVNDNLKLKVFTRDNFKCVICSSTPAIDSKTQLEIDHIILRAKGGITSLDNCQTLCSTCNRRKGKGF